MNRSAWRTGAAVLTGSALLVAFQNCGKLSALKPTESHSNPHIMRTSSVESINTDINFRVHDESLSPSAQFSWVFTLDGAASGCSPKTAANASTYILNCSAPGALKVSVTISDAGESQTLSYDTVLTAPANGNEIPMDVVFEIPTGTNNSPWNTTANVVEVFIGQKLKLKNMDSGNHQLHTNGRPCPHGNLIVPGATVDCMISQTYNYTAANNTYDHLDGPSADFKVIAHDGAALYTSTCAGCHGPLGTSAKLNAKVSQILSARSSKLPMIQNAAVQALTRRQIEAISYALGGR